MMAQQEEIDVNVDFKKKRKDHSVLDAKYANTLLKGHGSWLPTKNKGITFPWPPKIFVP